VSTGTRLAYADALPIAQAVFGQLDPACERLSLAGSLRRHAADVGDIELVAIPRYIDEPSSLWGDTSRASVLSRKLADLEAPPSPMVERVSGGGRYVKLRHLRSGMQVDLFITTPEQWGLILLIRTGPAAYSHALMTEARRRGFHSGKGRLWHGAGHPTDVECNCELTETPIPTPTEESVYAALGLPFVEPEQRV
jgi:DNA polymerase (family 10)